MKNGVKVMLVLGGAVGVTATTLFVASKIKQNKAKKEEEEQKQIEEGTKTNSNNTTSKWVAESFPLKRWCKGDNVKKLQKVLGVTEDGYFGTDTENALYSKSKVKECSKELFDSFMNTNTNGSNIPLSSNSNTNSNSEEPTSLMKDYCKKIYDATINYAWGTDEEAIQNVFLQIKTINDLYSLQNAWVWYLINVKKYDKTYANQKCTLTSVLKDELSSCDLNTYVNIPLRANGVNYSF